jgi:hypothetical protein
MDKLVKLTSDTLITKYAVIELNCINYDVTIKDVFPTHQLALSYLMQVIDLNNTLEDPYQYKKYSENKNLITVYKTGYIYGKFLHSKFFIKEYEEEC